MSMPPLDTSHLGRLLVVVGLLVAGVGLVLLAGGRFPLGRLPGDISGSRGGVSFYLPLGTSLVLSVLLTIVVNVFLRR